MSVRFNQFGHRLPVTHVLVEPNVVFSQKDDRILIGIRKKKHVKKTENAFIRGAGFAPRFKKEVKIPSLQKESQPQPQIKIGDKIPVTIFEPHDEVKVTGVTRGRGFTGSVKRWGFAGGPKTHGQSDRHRAPGSIGQTTTPGRVFKGKKMAGHMGVAKLTVTHLEVIQIDPQNNMLVIKGPLPGPKNGLLIIEKTGKVKTSVPQTPPVSKEEAAKKEEQ